MTNEERAREAAEKIREMVIAGVPMRLHLESTILAALNAATAELEEERGRLREVLEDVSLGEVYGKKFMAINNVLGGFWSIELTGEEDIAAATEWDARRRSALAKKEPSNA